MQLKGIIGISKLMQEYNKIKVSKFATKQSFLKIVLQNGETERENTTIHLNLN